MHRESDIPEEAQSARKMSGKGGNRANCIRNCPILSVLPSAKGDYFEFAEKHTVRLQRCISLGGADEIHDYALGMDVIICPVEEERAIQEPQNPSLG